MSDAPESKYTVGDCKYYGWLINFLFLIFVLFQNEDVFAKMKGFSPWPGMV